MPRKVRVFRRPFLLQMLLAAVLGSSIAAGEAHAGYAHLIIDANTGKVLSAQNAEVLNHPASLTKMMTLYMTFEALHDGRLSWDQKIVMSRNGAATIPTKLGVPAGKTFTVREAVLGMIVKSANDAAEAMGDHLSGSETKFANAMTRKARTLGMSRTTFRNASGLPDSRQVTTAHDMATLATALMRDYPKEYALFATKSFSFRGRRITGHNNLMYRYKGMDGIKTGFTNASGFNVVSAVNDNGRRVIGVVLGGKTARGRDARMATLLDEAMPKAAVRSGTAIAGVSVKTPLDLPRTDIPIPVMAKRSATVEIASASDDISDIIQAAAGHEGAEQQGWDIQIAAAPSEKAARRLLARAKTDALAGYDDIAAYTQKVGGKKADLYRARFTGFGSRASAVSACTALESQSFPCLVVPKAI